jgi:hypothetical protein
MLKPLLIGACLLALTGCASGPDARHSAMAATKDSAAGTSVCLTDTGSRVPVSPGQCSAYGRSYSGDELQQQGAGAGNVGTALQNLDTRITVQH